MKVINPITNRSINVGGPKFNQLLKDGYVFENNQLKLKKLTLYEAILYESTPNDLLSLYLTDEAIQKILNSHFLQLLNDKYKIKSTNFIEFFQAYNIKNLQQHHLLYLYNLENALYKPKVINKTNRYECVLALYNKKKELKLSFYIFGLAVTLMDVYQVYNVDVAMVCMYIASYTLMEYTDIDLYTKHKKDFIKLEIDIVNQLNGYLLRPSTVFFVNKKHEKLAMLSYFNDELTNYKPSLIAETISYMLTGTYKIYLVEEMPCQLLKETLNLKLFTIKIKHECEEHKELKTIIVNQPKFWHIGDFKKVKKVGEGIGGKVYKIKAGKDQYVLKNIKDNIECSILEIMILQNLKSPYIVELYGFKILTKKTELYLTAGQYNLKEAVEKDLLNDHLIIYMEQLLRGLDYCHFYDIIHRDIKPENIIYDGQFKLIDFGLSVPYSKFKSYLDPDLCSTIHYRAPEAFLGDTHYTTKVDIWALCLVFYYMITKKELAIDTVELLFKQFGTPNDQTWPGVTKLPHWDKRVYKGKILKLGKYQFISKGLVLNPKKRADTSTLLNLIVL